MLQINIGLFPVGSECGTTGGGDRKGGHSLNSTPSTPGNTEFNAYVVVPRDHRINQLEILKNFWLCSTQCNSNYEDPLISFVIGLYRISGLF